MKINQKLNGTNLLISLDGRLDTTTAPELEAVLKEALEGITNLTLDFNNLAYISSAGLRVILSTQKRMAKQGSMKIINTNQDVKDVFDMTGFSDIITIE